LILTARNAARHSWTHQEVPIVAKNEQQFSSRLPTNSDGQPIAPYRSLTCKPNSTVRGFRRARPPSAPEHRNTSDSRFALEQSTELRECAN
jgi:hypothetical protein